MVGRDHALITSSVEHVEMTLIITSASMSVQRLKPIMQIGAGL